MSDTLSYAYTTGAADNIGLTDTLSFTKSLSINELVGLSDSPGSQVITPNNFATTINDALGLTDTITVKRRHVNILPGYFSFTNAEVHVTSDDPIMFYIP
jgi:hypothetical protein